MMTSFKKLLMAFALLSISMGANALTVNLDPFTLDPTEAAGALSGGYNVSNVTGAFDIDILFEVVNASSAPGSANVISVQLGSFFGVDTIAATLNGAALIFSNGPSLVFGSIDTFFNSGSYTLNLTGTTFPNGATLSGNVALGPSAVPVPAAFWLFGTALMGLFGINRRSKK